jgi:hypothetical protein
MFSFVVLNVLKYALIYELKMIVKLLLLKTLWSGNEFDAYNECLSAKQWKNNTNLIVLHAKPILINSFN